MKNIFAYESKFMQTMLIAADYIILNAIFILCCIPIITIGAAQAGLHTGIRVLRDKEDDSSPLKAFFRGFKSGFGRITLVWCSFALVIALLAYILIAVFLFDLQGLNAPVWMGYLGIFLCIVYQSMLTPLHAAFGCTARQLVRNVFFIFLAHPLRSIAVAVLTWVPVIIFALNFPIFLQGTIVWIAGYYSIAFSVIHSIMKKPFQRFTENFVAAQEATDANNIAGN